jgi:hypothetical protein
MSANRPVRHWQSLNKIGGQGAPKLTLAGYELKLSDIKPIPVDTAPIEHEAFPWGREHTLDEIGESFFLSRERIRTIEAQALRKLRDFSRAKHLIQFWANDWD